FLDEVAADDARARAGLVHERRVVQVRRREDAGHRSADPQLADQGARVNALQADDVALGEVLAETLPRAEVARVPGEFADDEALNLDLARLLVLVADPVVADMRIGHRDDLALVRGIRQYLLVPGHAGVEDDLAKALPGGPEAMAGVDSPVLE